MPENHIDGEQGIEVNIDQYVEILVRRRWILLAIAVAVFTAATSYAFLATPVFRASTMLNIEREISNATPGAIVGFDDDSYIDTQFKLIASETALRRVYADLKLSSTRDFADGLKSLKDAITITRVPNTRLCNVNVDSTDPQLAVNISGTLAQYFVEQNLNSQLFMSKHVLDALQMRIRGSDAQKIRESLPSVVNSQLIQNIKSQIFTQETQLADLRMKFTDSHPTVQAAKSRLETMRKVLDNEVDNIVQSLKTQLSGELRGNNARIIDLPRLPDRPVRPKKVLCLLFGLMGGLAMGVFAVLIIDLLDQTVRTQNDVELRLRLSFLGIVPFSRHKKDAKIYAPLLSDEASLLGEAFRNVRTMVNLALAGHQDPLLLVTSAVQEEGKSFVATNLAVALAQLGQKVLLVDGDMRRPRLHRNLHASKEKGLVDFLSGGIVHSGDIVQKTDIPTLDVVTCGARPPKPAELLHSEHLDRFLSWAKVHYARIIVDCPPVFPVSDVLLWGQKVKSAIFVTRYGLTRVPLIRTASLRLRTGGIDILGCVVNSARLGTMSYADGRYYVQYYRDYTEPEKPKNRRS